MNEAEAAERADYYQSYDQGKVGNAWDGTGSYIGYVAGRGMYDAAQPQSSSQDDGPITPSWMRSGPPPPAMGGGIPKELLILFAIVIFVPEAIAFIYFLIVGFPNPP